MQRALITGAGGQDGWYLAELLSAQGVSVFGLVTPEDTTDLYPGIVAVPGDVRDVGSIRSALDVADPDEIYNLAAISSVGESWHDPELVADVNGLGLLRLVVAARERSRQSGKQIRIVQASSSEIFGDAAPPCDELTPISPITPYGSAKAFAHHVARTYRAAGDWVATAILFNHESPRRPRHFLTRKIAEGAVAVAEGRADELVLGDLSVRRDWGFAGDYVRAMVAIARHEAPDDFVVATGTSHAVSDFVAAAFAQVGIADWDRYVRSSAELRRAAEASDQRGNPAKAHAELGWSSTVDFDGVVALLIDAERARAVAAGR